MSIIIGIDPGSRVTGWGIVKSYPERLEHLGHGCIRLEQPGHPERLWEIFSNLRRVVEEYRPNQAAVEEVFMGRNASSALKLGQARGSAMVACRFNGMPVVEYSARKVKQALAGNGAASKEQVQHMVKFLLQLDDDIAEDAADALAVAICHAHSGGSPLGEAIARSWSRGRYRP